MGCNVAAPPSGVSVDFCMENEWMPIGLGTSMLIGTACSMTEMPQTTYAIDTVRLASVTHSGTAEDVTDTL